MTTERSGVSSSFDDAKSGSVLWQLLYWAELFSIAASFVEWEEESFSLEELFFFFF